MNPSEVVRCFPILRDTITIEERFLKSEQSQYAAAHEINRPWRAKKSRDQVSPSHIFLPLLKCYKSCQHKIYFFQLKQRNLLTWGAHNIGGWKMQQNLVSNIYF